MPLIRINNWSGGLSDSIYRGSTGSYAPGSYGMDIHSEPGVLQCDWVLAKDSGTTVTDLIIWAFQGTDGSTYFAGNAGKIYKRTSGGAWSNVWTDGGAARITGFIEYNGNFYWSTSTKLYKMAIGGDWSAGITIYDYTAGAWQAAGTTWQSTEIDTEWHPMIIMPSGDLAIGAGRYITTVDTGDLVTIQALTLPVGWRVRDIDYQSDYTVIGAWKGANINEGMIFYWDGYADVGYTPVPVGEGKVNALFSDGSVLLASVGNRGNIYTVSQSGLQIIKRIPGDYMNNPSYGVDVYPSAIDNYRGLYLIGLSFSANHPCLEGVYSLGSPNKGYPTALNLQYRISTANTSNVVIGAVLGVGGDLYVSWKDTTTGTVYGVDKLSATSFAQAYWKTQNLWQNRPKRLVKKIFLTFEELPASTSIRVRYQKNSGSGWYTVATHNTEDSTELLINLNVLAHTFQMDFLLQPATSFTPRITSIDIEYADTQI